MVFEKFIFTDFKVAETDFATKTLITNHHTLITVYGYDGTIKRVMVVDISVPTPVPEDVTNI